MGDKNIPDFQNSLSNLRIPTYNILPKVNIPTPHISQLNPAQWAYERIVEYIKDFEESLDHELEVGASLVSFSNLTVFHITDIGYYGPDIITFHGVNENDEKVQLIQHVSQLNLLLVGLTKKEEKARRIGFELMRKLENDKVE